MKYSVGKKISVYVGLQAADCAMMAQQHSEHSRVLTIDHFWKTNIANFTTAQQRFVQNDSYSLNSI